MGDLMDENEFKGLDHKKLLDEQQALEQAEAVGFCVPRKCPESSYNHTGSLPSEWGTHVRRDSYGSNNRRTTATDYWRGSGDATAERSTTTVSRSNDEDEDEGGELCHRDLSDESIPLLQAHFGPRLSKNTVRETMTPQPSTAGQTVQRSSSVNTCRTAILSRVSTRVTNKPPSEPSTEPSSKTSQDELGGETWSPRSPDLRSDIRTSAAGACRIIFPCFRSTKTTVCKSSIFFAPFDHRRPHLLRHAPFHIRQQ
uniref:Prolyl 4-hydroxylase subunit alpha-1 n=1 Tax=Lygus hesperus TaxID=30085 RepID=A0A0A9ZHZ7_LYGHE